MIAPILEEVAKEYAGKITIAKMDVDANQAVPAQFGIRGIPTLILFKGAAAAQSRRFGKRSIDCLHRRQYLIVFRWRFFDHFDGASALKFVTRTAYPLPTIPSLHALTSSEAQETIESRFSSKTLQNPQFS